jgi:hypothetical protein
MLVPLDRPRLERGTDDDDESKLGTKVDNLAQGVHKHYQNV